MRVLVLGAGPSGLVAAHAAVQLGHEVTILSKSHSPSKLYGTQYLHAPVPGYEDVPSVRVSYTLNGTPEQYRRKVYGDAWQGKVSPEDFVGEHRAWDIRETYRLMWELYRWHVKGHEVVDGNLQFARSLYEPDKIISTIPATSLCEKTDHTFTSHKIYANGSTIIIKAPSPDFVLCDGTDKVDWYRNAQVFGYRTVEWPSSAGVIGLTAVPVTKPLKTDCDCHPEVIRAGRYGEWDKSVLVHQVYAKVTEALSA
jgi:putative NAD(P)-binding protein